MTFQCTGRSSDVSGILGACDIPTRLDGVARIKYRPDRSVFLGGVGASTVCCVTILDRIEGFEGGGTAGGCCVTVAERE